MSAESCGYGRGCGLAESSWRAVVRLCAETYWLEGVSCSWLTVRAALRIETVEPNLRCLSPLCLAVSSSPTPVQRSPKSTVAGLREDSATAKKRHLRLSPNDGETRVREHRRHLRRMCRTPHAITSGSHRRHVHPVLGSGLHLLSIGARRRDGIDHRTDPAHNSVHHHRPRQPDPLDPPPSDAHRAFVHGGGVQQVVPSCECTVRQNRS